MALELSELHSFLVLTNHLHFGQAAEELRVSQPALTKQIQRLEVKVGGPLLIRGYRRVTLTPAGEILRDRARNLLRESEIAEQMARLAVNGKAGLLRIGLSMRDMPTPDQVEALEHGNIDVGFVRLPIERAELATVPVLEEMLVAAVPSGMSYRGGLPGLRKEPFVVMSRSVSASLFDHVVRTCRTAGFSPRIVQEAGELFTVLNLVRAGVGVSLVPRAVSLMRVPGVRLMDTNLAEAKWKIGLAWRKLDQSDPLVRNFVSLARQPRNSVPTGSPRH
jgi:DNA-binding transcriptional LysR family regulator